MRRRAALLLLAFAACQGAGANELHPQYPLLDSLGRSVLLSGRPLSTMETCGACHDTAFIESTSDHADAGAGQIGNGGGRYDWAAGPGYYGGWDPLRYDVAASGGEGDIEPRAWLRRYGARHAGGGPAGEHVEMDCLLCHSDLGVQEARAGALSKGDFRWANSVALSKRGILVDIDGQWEWNAFMFQPDGSLNKGLLNIRKPRDENCGQCHGLVANDLETPLTVPDDLDARSMTDRTGQIISPQKIHNSGLNIAGKEARAHAFDVHSDRVVGCVGCHYSLNNPVYFQQREESRPVHLEFDPRRLTSAEYLQKPVHQFAKGKSTLGLASRESENSLRRCESCHDASNVHEWLPYKERHFHSLACESCHVPRLYGPALQALDWTLVGPEGLPRRQYRDVEGDPSRADSLIHGFRPVLLARDSGTGERKLAPFNLVTSWYWLAGDPPRPVTREELERALFRYQDLHPDLLGALDGDGDGQVGDQEFRLTGAGQTNAVRLRLEAIGLTDVRLAGEITPFPVSHNVVNGRWATRECSACHGRDSILAAKFTLSDYAPGGLLPSGGARQASLDGVIASQPGGAVSYTPQPDLSGYYIIGLNGLGWIDGLGLIMFLGVSLGVAGHAVGRYIARRRRPRGHHPTQRVYMYDAYERLWHWLQASAILILLGTGLIIHKPHIFGIFNFAYIVQVHNVLGFIVLINAALALFYNLASGEIRQYLPEPRGFIGRSVAQAMYYTRGIFAGEPHPLEKTRERKLNPLQQITYLAILNVLLPAQVITGIFIWGLQKWPQLATSLGGLPVLAPIHTLVAWAFSAFIVMHVYLTTAAGETPGAGIRSMVSGWEDVEQSAHRAVHRDKEPKDD